MCIYWANITTHSQRKSWISCSLVGLSEKENKLYGPDISIYALRHIVSLNFIFFTVNWQWWLYLYFIIILRRHLNGKFLVFYTSVLFYLMLSYNKFFLNKNDLPRHYTNKFKIILMTLTLSEYLNFIFYSIKKQLCFIQWHHLNCNLFCFWHLIANILQCHNTAYILMTTWSFIQQTNIQTFLQYFHMHIKYNPFALLYYNSIVRKK